MLFSTNDLCAGEQEHRIFLAIREMCRVRQPGIFVFAASEGRMTRHECLRIVDSKLGIHLLVLPVDS
jgi:hypothetical protein